MSLKALIKELTEVDEALRPLYVKTDDGFVLDVEEKGYKDKLDEFRTNNRALHKKAGELEAQMAQYKDIDPTKYKEAQEALKKVRELEDKQLLDEGKVEELLARRTESMRADFANQIKAKDTGMTEAQQRATALQSRLSELLIEQNVTTAVTKAGKVRQGALDDVRLRASRVWKVDDKGTLQAKGSDGNALFNKKGEALTLEDWAQELVTTAPHLFEASGGGGAGGGSRRDGNTPDGVKVIKNDPLLIGKYAKEIAEGKVVVSQEE